MNTTYTMLVTIAHDSGAAPSTDLLEVIVQRGLEAGVRDCAGVCSAQVTAFEGEHLKSATTGDLLCHAQVLHKILRS